MSIFIKAGLWLEKKTGFKGEFNLTRYVTDLIASTPVASYWTKTGDNIVNNNTGKVEIVSQGNADWDIGTSVFMHSSNYKNNLYISSENLELRGKKSIGNDFGNIYLGGGASDYTGFLLWGQGKSGFLVHSDINGKYFKLDLIPNNSEAIFTDTTTTPKGLQYAVDYSANYTNRSLVDKGYVASIARPYKVYTALLTQAGTNAPTAIVLENTFEDTFTLQYMSAGYYRLYSSSSATWEPYKTTLFYNLGFNYNPYTSTIAVQRNTADTISIYTGVSGTATNGLLDRATLEIRVYN